MSVDHEGAAAPEGTPHPDGAARTTEGNMMNDRTNTEQIDDEATRASARSIVERHEQDERERRARYARPLNFSRHEASASPAD